MHSHDHLEQLETVTANLGRCTVPCAHALPNLALEADPCATATELFAQAYQLASAAVSADSLLTCVRADNLEEGEVFSNTI